MFNFNLSLLILGLFASFKLIVSKAVDSNEKDPLSSRIFKGQYDYANEHRYHVAILQVKADDTTEHICGGAIIDSRFVITAAHCVYGRDKKDLVIRSGWNKNPESPELEKRVYHRVAKVMYLKDYVHSECRRHEHDIAVVKVQRNFDLADDSNFRKVNLPEYDNDYEGYQVTFTGYGVEKITRVVNKTADTVKNNFKYPEELKYLETEVIPIEGCKRVAPVIVTNGNLCTRQLNTEGFSCIGDSGGPLVHDGVVVGIRNSHNKQCIHAQPEMFTRVSTYLEFINKVVNQEASADVYYD